MHYATFKRPYSTQVRRKLIIFTYIGKQISSNCETFRWFQSYSGLICVNLSVGNVAAQYIHAACSSNNLPSCECPIYCGIHLPLHKILLLSLPLGQQSQRGILSTERNGQLGESKS
ncbi:hypothetical protein PoB_002636600 [Plakobranchus ocellatus]|uniref:Uncharacterized protein n=1 Tax=Plakobranchus ocellatus TaxID=259542 RepID=A0AAV3ZL65_9GAST|nr:hypothetical protein PoB_002636600 [Plakobranchus ocellatus]